MRELEKILEEIEQRVDYYREHATLTYVDICAGLREAEGIIHKHMNDGWISVEERLPEEEYYPALCVTNENYYCVAVYNKTHGFRTGDICTVGEIVAWRPLPEPYRPERSDNHDGE